MDRSRNQTKNMKGFSLLEIILTLALLLLITAITFPTTLGNVQKSKARTISSQIATDLYYQQQRARSKNISTGVYFENGRYTLFDGDSFSVGTEKDQKILPSNIRISSISLTTNNSVLFEGSEFKPVSFGSLYVLVMGQSFRVSMNEEGLIEYE